MRTLMLTVALAALFYSYVYAFQISLDSSGISYNLDTFEDPVREKRQVEIFDDEYPTAVSQNEEEEPGFWDRIVKVALKIFSKFIEWLNS
ncbi:unnamed protein product [Arctia plantaginis]|uniref:Uncharacterized protein n=1 Tax=Arctia plantaginis TaxID=874455 RepID=A0A8S1A912_ARCPL|nr:unnamed protein product [Arctia plantaginis]